MELQRLTKEGAFLLWSMLPVWIAVQIEVCRIGENSWNKVQQSSENY